MPAFITLVVDSDGAPVPNAVVGLFTENGEPITSETTSDDGRAPMIGPDQLVSLRVVRAHYIFPRRIFMRPVDGATFTVVGVASNLAAPMDPQRCRVYGKLVDPLGGAFTKHLPMKVSVIGRVSGDPVDVMVTSNADVALLNGGFTMDLLRGWQYRFGPLPITEITDEAPNYEYIVFNVPDRDVVNFIDLADPYADHVDGAPDEVSLTVDTSVTSYTLEVVLSDDTIARTATEYLSVTSSAETIATVALINNTLTIRRVGPGVATLTFNTKTNDTVRVESAFFSGRPVRTLRTARVTCV